MDESVDRDVDLGLLASSILLICAITSSFVNRLLLAVGKKAPIEHKACNKLLKLKKRTYFRFRVN